MAGVLLATLVNHGLSAWLAVGLRVYSAGLAPYIVAASFIAVGLWLLVPDKDDDEGAAFRAIRRFVASLVLFFLAGNRR